MEINKYIHEHILTSFVKVNLPLSMYPTIGSPPAKPIQPTSL